MDTTKCPNCGSENWRCWDEWYEDFEDQSGQVYSLPVGGLKCRECGHTWEDATWTEDDGITPLIRLD